ncbi:MAG: hypothetical protein CMJ84_02975 [Planctomycetes bacterium]|jgi:hypothetical protein|nr:hypothetical protein [Planctomycetota bacterium]MDP6408036.1 hypothetical protein [Planctomycetota bacterium]
MWSPACTCAVVLASALGELPDGLPDFSGAGYRGGAPLPERAAASGASDLDIRNHGALPGDGIDDGPAIQAALDAAAAAGGGVVHLGAGRWTLASRVTIHGDGVVLQGAGSGGTLLECPLSLTDIAGPSKNWSWSGGLLSIAPRPSAEPLGVAGAAPGGVRAFPVVLEGGVPPPRPGEWLELAWYNDTGEDTLLDHLHGGVSYPDLVFAELAKRTDPRLTEWLRVESYAGGTLSVSTPIGLELRSEWSPRLTRRAHISECGVAGLSFLFPETARRPHLKEKGYNALTISNAIDCWVRDIVVDHGDSGVGIGTSRQVTVDGALMTGKGMHHPFTLSRSTHCLVTNWRIEAPHRHGTTLTWGAHHNVYSKGWGRDLALDCHRANPFENLHTEIEIEVTGRLKQPLRSGGSYGRGPHSARGNVYWNVALRFLAPVEPIEVKGLAEWPRGVFVGWHGDRPLRLAAHEGYGLRVVGTGERPAITNLHEHQRAAGESPAGGSKGD